MKICHIASTYPRFPGDGAGRFVRSIAEAIADEGHEVHVLAPYHPSVAPMDGPVTVHHFRYVWPDSLAIMGYAEAMQSDRRLRRSAYLLAPLFAASEFTTLARLMRRHQFDVLHAHWVVPNAAIVAGLARFLNVPMVVSLHGSDVFVARNNRTFGAVARWTFAQASTITACSPDLEQGALSLGAPRERTHLVPWGADPETFGNAGDVSDLRERWGLARDAPILLTLARLVKKKGIDYLVRALPAIQAQLPNVRLIIAGDGPEREPLQQLARDLGIENAVVFTGTVEWNDVPVYMHMSDVFVVPSVHDDNGNVDGLPTTIPEAMAAGIPVVASNIAGIPLVVQHERTGLLVEEKQPAHLATAIVRLLANPELRLQYGNAGREYVEAELNWHAVAQRFVVLYRDAT